GGGGRSNGGRFWGGGAWARGWAGVMRDLGGESLDMDKPMTQAHLVEKLRRFGREPRGLTDFHVFHPLSCASDRKDSKPFTLRVADFDSSVTAELLQATNAERNALLDCIDYYQQRFYTQLRTSDLERE